MGGGGQRPFRPFFFWGFFSSFFGFLSLFLFFFESCLPLPALDRRREAGTQPNFYMPSHPATPVAAPLGA